MAGQRPIRVGDAERDLAASALAEHFAAGRLTKDEHDKRTTALWSARYQHDLAEVFADLPVSTSAQRDAEGTRRWGRPETMVVLVGIVVVVSLIVITRSPMALGVLFWAFVLIPSLRRWVARQWRDVSSRMGRHGPDSSA